METSLEFDITVIALPFITLEVDIRIGRTINHRLNVAYYDRPFMFLSYRGENDYRKLLTLRSIKNL